MLMYRKQCSAQAANGLCLPQYGDTTISLNKEGEEELHCMLHTQTTRVATFLSLSHTHTLPFSLLLASGITQTLYFLMQLHQLIDFKPSQHKRRTKCKYTPILLDQWQLWKTTQIGSTVFCWPHFWVKSRFYFVFPFYFYWVVSVILHRNSETV